MDNSVKKAIALLVFFFAFCSAANADIWRWIDTKGDVHFVNTLKPIYTWLDEEGSVNFSDTPDHEDAVSVDLVWHSKGNSIEDAEAEQKQAKRDDGWAHPNETAEERIEREKAEAYYCKNAQQIHDSYVNAPRLYRTVENGDRLYLSDEEIKTTLAETESRVDELCDM